MAELDFKTASEQELVAHFQKKFTAIPENKWITESYIDDKGACCALGHCGERLSFNKNVIGTVTGESEALDNLLMREEFDFISVATINDGHSELFQQNNPKLRILSVLEKISQSLKSA